MSEETQGSPPPIPMDQIKWRKQGNKPSNGEYQFVPYIDARHAAACLDEWVGPLGWKVEYGNPEKWETPGNSPDEWVLWCRLSVRRPDGEWVTKADVGKASNFEPEKGLVSDAMKRAAVAWGVGRNVYDIGIVWAKSQGDAERKAAKMYGTPAPAPAPTPPAPSRAEGTEKREVFAPPVEVIKYREQANLLDADGKAAVKAALSGLKLTKKKFHDNEVTDSQLATIRATVNAEMERMGEPWPADTP